MSASSGATYDFGTGSTGDNNNVVSYDHNNTNSTVNKNNCTTKLPYFSKDNAKFSWWKSKMYSHILDVDDELWDIIEDDVNFQVDFKGITLWK